MDISIDAQGSYCRPELHKSFSVPAAHNPTFTSLLAAAAYALHTTANSSVVNRENCHKAAGLAADVLRIVEAAWRRQHSAASQVGLYGLS
jgi:hypothetical protein